VGPTVPGECDDDPWGNYGTHGGTHAGKEASTTIKLWRLDLEANQDLDPQLGYPNYHSVFADSVTTTATVVGSSALEYRWRSWLGASIHKEITKSSGSWSGRLIDYTSIDCWVKVINQCDLTRIDFAERGIYIDATTRRPEWTTEVQLAGVNDNWLSDLPPAFPQIDWGWHTVGSPPRQELPTYGRNTNARTHYENEFNEVVVPYYSNNSGHFAADYASFFSKVSEITSGPHKGFFYNNDPTMYQINRQILSNHWINPLAGHPSTPALDNNGNAYTNWLAVFEAHIGADCKCLSPTTHGGTGTGTFYQANLYHEGTGNPNSPNNRLLGHHSRLEDGFASGSRALLDPIYRCDLLYSDDKEVLRAMDEGHRQEASEELLLLLGALHGYVKYDPAKHNYTGDVFIYTPGAGWHAMGKDTF